MHLRTHTPEGPICIGLEWFVSYRYLRVWIRSVRSNGKSALRAGHAPSTVSYGGD